VRAVRASVRLPAGLKVSTIAGIRAKGVNNTPTGRATRAQVRELTHALQTSVVNGGPPRAAVRGGRRSLAGAVAADTGLRTRTRVIDEPEGVEPGDVAVAVEML